MRGSGGVSRWSDADGAAIRCTCTVNRDDRVVRKFPCDPRSWTTDSAKVLNGGRESAWTAIAFDAGETETLRESEVSRSAKERNA